ncbi:MAG: hypothetical protein AB7E47_15860 [Desulfovibrionaceae bacterium]
MAQKYLGDYLIARGALTPEQRDAALLRQRALNKRMGELALELDLLTPEQVTEVLCRQEEEDLAFGDAAMALGYLSEAERNRLLFHRLVRHRHLGEMCVAMGFVEKHACDAAIADFVGRRARHVRRVEQHLAGLDRTTMVRVACDAVCRVFLRFTGQRLVLQDVGAPFPQTPGLTVTRFDACAGEDVISWLVVHDANPALDASDHPAVAQAGGGFFAKAMAAALRDALGRDGVAAQVSHHSPTPEEAPPCPPGMVSLLLHAPAGRVGITLL